MKLLIIINRNNLIKIRLIPLDLLFGVKFLIFLFKELIILIDIIVNCDGISQQVVGIIIIIKNDLIQFNDENFVDEKRWKIGLLSFSVQKNVIF